MKFVFFKFILLFFPLFIFSVEADPSQSKTDQMKPQEKEVQPPSQVKKEEQSSSQKKEVQPPSQVKEEEQSSSQKKEVPSQPQVKVKKEEPQKVSGQLQILEIKKGTATVKVPAHQKLSIDQILYAVSYTHLTLPTIYSV